ncbi:MAG TPA: hypothetical protein VIJ01_05075 [Candidatus Angelobacter sp.]
MQGFGPFCALRIFLLLSWITCAQAQNTNPPSRSFPEIESQIRQLQDENRRIDALLNQNIQEMWSFTYQFTSDVTEGVLSPLFGTQRDYENLGRTIDVAAMEFQSGHGAIAASKLVDAAKQSLQLIKLAANTLDGTINPEDMLKSYHDLADATKALSGIYAAFGRDSLLKDMQTRLNAQISKLQDEQFAAPYIARGQGSAPKDKPVPDEITFDPSKLSPEAYAGWLKNQERMRSETLGQSDPELRVQELRRQAAQAQSDLNDAQQQYEIQTSQDTYRAPGTADVIAPGTATRTGVQSPEPSIYPQITTSSKWQSPRNYRCASGPCTLEQWQQENTSKTNQCNGAGCTGSQITGNNGQTPAPTRQPQKPPQPTPASGGDDPLSHAWLCQQLASIVQHDKNSLAACRAKDQLCIQMFQAAVQSDLKNFNSNNCDPKLLR